MGDCRCFDCDRSQSMLKENDVRKRHRLLIRTRRCWALIVFVILSTRLLYQSPFLSPSSSSSQSLDESIVTFYKNLHSDELSRRNPHKIESLAIHRPLGRTNSTLAHYQLIHDALLLNYTNKINNPSAIKVVDAGCGLGAGLLWFEQHEPQWKLEGYNLSPTHIEYIRTKLPPHKFQVFETTFDQLRQRRQQQQQQQQQQSSFDCCYDAIYSIEALVHSPDYRITLSNWYQFHLRPGGRVVLIDDYLANDDDDNHGGDGSNNSTGLPEEFRRAWRLPSLVTMAAFERTVQSMIGFKVIQSRDLTVDFAIPRFNYPGTALPDLANIQKQQHGKPSPPWWGAKVRHVLTKTGQLKYMMYVLEKGKEG